MSGIGTDANNIIDDILVTGSRKQQSKSIQGTSIGVEVDSVALVVFWQEFIENLLVFHIAEN